MTTIDRLTSALADRYRVDRELGQGGMATVFLAHDLRHERHVAIKVLHPELGAALGAERFLGEIRTTARLQHPNILPLLDSGEADGLLYYVMPLVEGETLRDRLERERQLPLDNALRIATEVAEALGYAHRQGVIHRDIKPENILLHDGRPIVADFGIALAVTAASGSRMTQTGLSLGTPQYMAPEQAMGDKSIDARADIYALGAVVYEMLTGEPPFTGATVQAIVAKVLTERPLHPTTVRDTIPRHVEATILKALAKLPADRFSTAADFAHALQHADATAALTAPQPAASVAARGARGVLGSPVLSWGVAALALVAAVWGWSGREEREALTEPTILAQVPEVDFSTVVTVSGVRPFVLSGDGRYLAWLGPNVANGTQVFVAALDGGSARPIPGTEGANGVLLSPDAKSVGFFRSGELLAVGVDGGLPRRLADARMANGATWAQDGWIVYTRRREVLRVRATGGEPEVLLRGGQDTSYAAPHVIEESGTLLLGRSVNGTSELVATALEGGPVVPLGIEATRAAYARGVLVYVGGDGLLRGVPFDPRQRRVTGESRPIADGPIATSPTRFDMSRSGLLAFNAQEQVSRELVMVDRAGRARSVSDRGAYLFPGFSPSGTRVAVGILGSLANTREGDLWSIDVTTRVKLRVTTDGLSTRPTWTPDGRFLIHSRRSGGGGQTLARVSADGTTPSTALLQRPASIFEAALTADGRTLAWREDNLATGRDIFAMPVDSPSAAWPVLQTRFNERGISMGPEGDWLAYASNESGRDEVYIRRLAPGSPRWPVSRNGGVEPRWTRSGELFFRRGDSVFVSRITTGTEPRIAEPSLLFTGQYQLLGLESTWDAAPDGKSFIMVTAPQGQSGVMLYANWLDRWKAANAQAR